MADKTTLPHQQVWVQYGDPGGPGKVVQICSTALAAYEARGFVEIDPAAAAGQVKQDPAPAPKKTTGASK